jgi:hypothetical protein
MRNAYSVSGVKPERKRPRRPRRGWKYIEMDLKEIV